MLDWNAVRERLVAEARSAGCWSCVSTEAGWEARIRARVVQQVLDWLYVSPLDNERYIPRYVQQAAREAVIVAKVWQDIEGILAELAEAAAVETTQKEVECGS